MATNFFETAILFLLFNRPKTTNKVFKIISKIRPRKLYISCDGPRQDNRGEKKLVREVQRIVSKIDWKCDVKKLYRDKNLGCKTAVSSAITWFFKYEQEGIILEDDCLPNLEFFSFCQKLLKYYRNNKKVFAITGNNFQNLRWRGNSSYYFSKYPHCWGWATWRRAWKNYQGNIPFWPNWCNSDEWKNLTPNTIERKYWMRIFNSVKQNKIDSWAYPWLASVWYKGGLTATPNVNLVSNIGFGNDATHTFNESKFSNLPTKNLGELNHPKNILRDKDADNLIFEEKYGGKNLRFPNYLINFPYRVFKYIYRKIKMLKKNFLINSSS